MRDTKKPSITADQIPRWIAPIIQALTIIGALAINFLIPIFYGVEQYGIFIQNNILVLVIHKFTDIVNEPLISYVQPKYLFITSLLSSILVLIVVQGINYYESISSQALLASMLLSSNCLLSMFAMRMQRLIVFHLLLVIGVFLALLTFDQIGFWRIDLVGLLLWTNLFPAMFSAMGLFLNGSKLPSLNVVSKSARFACSLFPRNFSTTFVFNTITNIFPYVLAKQMSAWDIGMFRVNTSILQAATSLFPINPKAILAVFVDGKDRERQMQTLIAVSLLYFSMVGIGAILFVIFTPNLARYLEMVAFLPILYWVVLLERYMQSGQNFRNLVVINLIIGVAMLISVLFVKKLNYAEFLYITGISIYLCALLLISGLRRWRRTIFLVALFSVLIFWLETILPRITLAYLFALFLTAILVMKLRPSDLMHLRT